jgi:hypothetical protein
MQAGRGFVVLSGTLSRKFSKWISSIGRRLARTTPSVAREDVPSAALGSSPDDPRL